MSKAPMRKTLLYTIKLAVMLEASSGTTRRPFLLARNEEIPYIFDATVRAAHGWFITLGKERHSHSFQYLYDKAKTYILGSDQQQNLREQDASAKGYIMASVIYATYGQIENVPLISSVESKYWKGDSGQQFFNQNMRNAISRLGGSGARSLIAFLKGHETQIADLKRGHDQSQAPSLVKPSANLLLTTSTTSTKTKDDVRPDVPQTSVPTLLIQKDDVFRRVRNYYHDYYHEKIDTYTQLEEKNEKLNKTSRLKRFVKTKDVKKLLREIESLKNKIKKDKDSMIDDEMRGLDGFLMTPDDKSEKK